jgi:hydroxymethylpyrimidine pyrophosphatase-like HAD family hydrolase
MNPYPPQKVIAVDVDGTLINKGNLNTSLVKWCKLRKSEGFSLMLWSARGERYARNVAEYHQVSDCFDLITSKPGYIVDDMGWSWIKFTKVIRSFV